MLFKNVYNTLKKRYVQLVLIGLIILLSSFMYTTMFYAISGIEDPTEKYFEEYNQEDFSVTTLNALLESDVSYITENCSDIQMMFSLSSLKEIDESCYYGVLENRRQIVLYEYENIDLELREYKNMYFNHLGDSHKVRFLKDSNKINLSFVQDGKGRKPINNNEIAISETYAIKNNLEIDDDLVINGKKYKVVGYVLFPDYSFPMISDELILDNAFQTIALLTDVEFEEVSTDVNFIFAGEFTSDYEEKDFKNNVIKDFGEKENISFITSIVLTKNQMRSGAIYGELSGGKAMGLGISMVIASIAIFIVGIMVYKIIQQERGQIGLIKSMGYKNSQITIPYVLYISLFALPVLIIGYFLGYAFSENFKQLYLDFYLLPSVDIEQKLSVFFVAVIVPFSFLIILSYIVIAFLLRQKPVDLLNPQVANKNNIVVRKVSKYFNRLKVKDKFKHLLVFRSLGKFYVYLIGIFYATILILFSFSMIGIFDKMTIDFYEKTDHNYIGYCDDYIKGCKGVDNNQDKVLIYPGATLGGEIVEIQGLDVSNSLHHLYNSKDKDITSKLSDGVIVSTTVNIKYGFGIGDEILLKAGENEFNVVIKGISEEYAQDKVYIERAYLIEKLGYLNDNNTENDDYYNVIYSQTELDSDNFMYVISNEDIITQSKSMQTLFNSMIILMVGVSIAIAVIIIYVLTIMTVEDNYYNISLLKVIGFNKKEVDSMILSGYFIYGMITFIATVPIAYFTFKFLVIYMARFYNVLMPLEILYWHPIVGIIIIALIFYLGTIFSKRKISKVSLQETLKAYSD